MVKPSGQPSHTHAVNQPDPFAIVVDFAVGIMLRAVGSAGPLECFALKWKIFTDVDSLAKDLLAG